MDLMTSTVLSLVAQASIYLCLFFQKVSKRHATHMRIATSIQSDYIHASMPENSEDDAERYIDLDASMTVALSVATFFCLLEIILLMKQSIPSPFAIYSLFSRAIGCTVFLKLVIDYHPIMHFWTSILVFNVSTLTGHIVIFLASFSKRDLC